MLYLVGVTYALKAFLVGMKSMSSPTNSLGLIIGEHDVLSVSLLLTASSSPTLMKRNQAMWLW
jgi:hypothetical protein